MRQETLIDLSHTENTMATLHGVQANISANVDSSFGEIMTKSISLNPELELQLHCVHLHEIKSIITQIGDDLIPQDFPYLENVMMDILEVNHFSFNDHTSSLIAGYLFFLITFQFI